MLDPMNAIILASSIAQLIDFSATLLKDASDIRSKGSSVNVERLKTLTRDLIDFGEAAFESLADECMKVADELVTVLTRVTSEHASGRWQSLRLALLTVRKKEKIETLANLLGEYRDQLTLRCTTIRDAKNDIHFSIFAERLDTLEQSVEEIKRLSLITHSILEKVLSSQNQICQNQQLPVNRADDEDQAGDEIQAGDDVQAGDEIQRLKQLFANDNFPNDENAKSRLSASKGQREPRAKLRHPLGEIPQTPKVTKRSRPNKDSDVDEFFKEPPMKKLSIYEPEGTNNTRC